MPEDQPNEIIAEARAAKASKPQTEKKAGNWPLRAIGLGVGIGSAAVAAALLYGNRHRNAD